MLQQYVGQEIERTSERRREEEKKKRDGSKVTPLLRTHIQFIGQHQILLQATPTPPRVQFAGG